MNLFRRPLFMITRKMTQQIGQEIHKRTVNINNTKPKPVRIGFFVHYNYNQKYITYFSNRKV